MYIPKENWPSAYGTPAFVKPTEVNHDALYQKAIFACYCAAIAPDTIDKVAERYGLDSVELSKRFDQWLIKRGAHQHMAAKNISQFCKLSEFTQWIQQSGPGCYMGRAHLGTGKTEGVALQLINHFKDHDKPIAYVTAHCSLVADAAQRLNIGHYKTNKDDRQVATTINSLSKQKLLLSDLKQQGGLLIIDEATHVAKVLFAAESTMKPREQEKAITILRDLASHGVTIVLLDGDLGYLGLYFAKLLSCKVANITEQRYRPPAVKLYPQLSVDVDGKKIRSAPHIKLAINELKAGRKVFLGCDSVRNAKTLYQLLAPFADTSICIHAKNKEEPDQSDFLTSPNEGAQKYQLMVSSPTITTGVSITSEDITIIQYLTTGNLKSDGTFQMARRPRRAHGNTIHMVVGKTLLHPQSGVSIDWNQVFKEYLAHDSDLLTGRYAASDFRIAGQYQHQRSQQWWNKNPFYALYGYLKNVGLQVSIAWDESIDGAADFKALKKEIKAQEVEVIRKAHRIDEDEYTQLKEVSTLEATSQCSRYLWEYSFALTQEDFDDMGHIPTELAEEVSQPKTLSTVRRLEALHLYRQGYLNSLNEHGKNVSLKRFEFESVQIVESLIEQFWDEQQQCLVFTNEEVLEAVESLQVGVLISAKGWIRPIPKQEDDKHRRKSIMRWFTSLLRDFGYTKLEMNKVGNQGLRRYKFAEDALIRGFVQKRWPREVARRLRQQVSAHSESAVGAAAAYKDLVQNTETTQTRLDSDEVLAAEFGRLRQQVAPATSTGSMESFDASQATELTITHINLTERAIHFSTGSDKVIVKTLNMMQLPKIFRAIWTYNGMANVEKELRELWLVLKNQTLTTRHQSLERLLDGQTLRALIFEDDELCFVERS